MSFFPPAPKRPYKITQHGETRIDNYYWMRDREDPEVLKYLRAESDYLEEVMGHTKPLQEMLYAEMKGRMQETDSSVPEKKRRVFLLHTHRGGTAISHLLPQKRFAGNPRRRNFARSESARRREILLQRWRIYRQPGWNKLAYSLDVEGGEVYTVYIKDLTNTVIYPEAIEKHIQQCLFHTGVEWANDSQTIFYLTLDPRETGQASWRHEIGTNPRTDTAGLSGNG